MYIIETSGDRVSIGNPYPILAVCSENKTVISDPGKQNPEL